jgi:hypothetical protein
MVDLEGFFLKNRSEKRATYANDRQTRTPERERRERDNRGNEARERRRERRRERASKQGFGVVAVRDRKGGFWQRNVSVAEVPPASTAHRNPRRGSLQATHRSQ